MNKPILIVLYLSTASSVGFISGYIFSENYGSSSVLENKIDESEFKNMMDWYTEVLRNKLIVEDLTKIQSMDDVMVEIQTKKITGYLMYVCL